MFTAVTLTGGKAIYGWIAVDPKVKNTKMEILQHATPITERVIEMKENGDTLRVCTDTVAYRVPAHVLELK